MAIRLCRSCGNWHDLNSAWPSECRGHFAVRGERSSLPRPMVISDHLDGIQSMVSGERFDSKSDLRRHYKANGVVELGNETIKPRDNDEADIQVAPIEREVAQAFEILS